MDSKSVAPVGLILMANELMSEVHHQYLFLSSLDHERFLKLQYIVNDISYSKDPEWDHQCLAKVQRIK